MDAKHSFLMGGLAAITILSLGAVGYFVYQYQHKTSPLSPHVLTVSKNPSDEEAGWEVNTNQDGSGFIEYSDNSEPKMYPAGHFSTDTLLSAVNALNAITEEQRDECQRNSEQPFYLVTTNDFAIRVNTACLELEDTENHAYQASEAVASFAQVI